ncbi:PorP/SprF family type IX secretion system membrane protein [Labilibaculum sp.]|uniref:PorP/SprF family type IX secretion system membrane protein n=1 Tax=Labilibaculum sp. TaxID=2060723 RepID=UPI00356A92CC
MEHILKFTFFSLFVFMCFTNSQAQEEIRFSNYKANQLFYNPAYAGTTGFMEGVLGYRKQWVDIEGAPETASLSFQAPINYTNSGLGIVAYNNKLGIQSDVAIFINYGYHIQIGFKGNLSMGLQAGFIHKQYNWGDLTFYDPYINSEISASDPIVSDGTESSWVPNFGLGFYYYTPDYYLSLSIPRLLTNDQISTGGISNNMSFDAESTFYYLGAGIKKSLNQEIDFSPSIFFVGSQKTSNLLSVNLDFEHESGISAGAGYRSDSSWAALLGYQFNQKMKFSYSYEKSFGNSTSNSNTTHEIILNYNLSLRKSQITSPRYF